MRERISRRQFGTVTGLGALGAVGLAGVRATSAQAATTTTPILTRSGSGLQLDGSPHRLSGMNAYWVGLDDNLRDSSGAPTFPAHETLTDAFAGMRAMGADLARCHTIGISAGTPKSFETACGLFSAANLDSADWAVAQAKKQGILLMIPLTDQWNYYHGGKGVFVHWAYQQDSSGLTDVPAAEHLFDADGAEKGSKTEDQFFSDSTACLRIRALFFDYLDRLMSHQNPYTGLSYAEDPTIAILETGNEVYPATAEWTKATAAHLKNIAPDKLIADGSAATGLAVADAPGRDVSEVDILGAHYYAADSDYQPAPIMTLADQLDRDVSSSSSSNKVFLMGEYPWTRSDINQWYAKIESTTGIAADLMWAFIGGAEVHGGSFGSDDVPVHYPYLGSEERQDAPALAHHISAISAVALSGTAGGPRSTPLATPGRGYRGRPPR